MHVRDCKVSRNQVALLKAFSLRFVPSALAVATLCVLLAWSASTHQRTIVEEQYLSVVQDASHAFQVAGARATSVLRLALQDAVQNFAANGTALEDEALVRTAKAWSLYWPFTHSVRYVGIDGFEKVSVTPVWRDISTLEHFVVKNASAGANVSAEPFFGPSVELRRGEFYVSRLMLDSRAPSGEEESVPLFYASAIVLEANTSALPGSYEYLQPEPPAAGFMVISFNATSLLADVLVSTSIVGIPNLSHGVGHVQTSVLNDDGYWVAGTDVPENAAFAWQTPGFENLSFAAAYPDVWARMQDMTANSTAAHFYHKKDLYAVYRNDIKKTVGNDYSTTAQPVANDPLTYVVIRVPHTYILGTGIKSYQVTACIVFGVGIVLCAILSAALVSSARAHAEAVERKISMEHFRSRNKELFLQTMCHEIRTPLNAIVGAIGMLPGPEISPEKASILRIMDDSANLMMGILNDILDVGKIESGALVINPQLFNVREVMGSCVDIHAAAATRKNIDVFLTFGGDVPESLVADDLRIRQICSNLLSNAVKFTQAGRISVSVETLSPLLPPPSLPSHQPSHTWRPPWAQGHRDSTVRAARRAVVARAPSRVAPLEKQQKQLLQLQRSRTAPLAAAAEDPSYASGFEVSSMEEGGRGPNSATGSASASTFWHAGGAGIGAAAAAVGAAASGGSSGSAEAPSHLLLIRVSDTGKGITPEGQKRIFLPFEQEEVGTTRSYGGSGLGLTICRKLAEAMGGSVAVTSASGQGSTFTVTIPVVAAEPPPSPSSPVPTLVSFSQPEDICKSANPPSARAQLEGSENDTPPAFASAAAAATLCVAVTGGGHPAHASALAEAAERSPLPVQMVLVAEPPPPPLGTADLLLLSPCKPRSNCSATARAVAAWQAAVAAATEPTCRDRRQNSGGVSSGCSGATDGPGSNGVVAGGVLACAAVVVVDTSAWTAGVPEALQELRQRALSAEGLTSAVIVLLDSQWAHLLGSETLRWCHVVTMPVTPCKLLKAFGSARAAFHRAGLHSDALPTIASAAHADEDRERAITVELSSSGARIERGRPLDAAASSFRRLRVLVCDDVAANRKILEHMLRRLGHSVMAAADGEEAVAADQKQDPPFNLIMLDLQMPGPLDGADACAKIVERHHRLLHGLGLSSGATRTNSLTKSIAAASDSSAAENEITLEGHSRNEGRGKQQKQEEQQPQHQLQQEQSQQQEQQQRHRPPVVVILTASALDVDRERCMKMGASSFLTKPLTWQRLNSFLSEDFPQLYSEDIRPAELYSGEKGGWAHLRR